MDDLPRGPSTPRLEPIRVQGLSCRRSPNIMSPTSAKPAASLQKKRSRNSFPMYNRSV